MTATPQSTAVISSCALVPSSRRSVAIARRVVPRRFESAPGNVEIAYRNHVPGHTFTALFVDKRLHGRTIVVGPFPYGWVAIECAIRTAHCVIACHRLP